MSENIAKREIEQKRKLFEELATKIWEHPETAFNEIKAAAWTAELLEQEGFSVERNYLSMPTALRATWGSGYPSIGFLAEYDALPGLSQKAYSTKKEAIINNGPGHGCGHNLLGAANVAAVVGLKKEMEEKGLQGTIVFYGCPAEEILTGKVFMAREGAFREEDVFLAWHPSSISGISIGSLTGLNTAKFHFHGITAHAGAAPHAGRSALDAAEIMNVGANYLREHVTSDVRIHYSYTDAGTAPNIVPDKATVWYYVRALTREAVVDTYDRLKEVARGAAIMNGVTVEEEFLGGCYNTLQNLVLSELVKESYDELGQPDWTQEDEDFALKMNQESGTYNTMKKKGDIKKDIGLSNGAPVITNTNSYGSTDVGDVSHIAPCTFFSVPTWNLGAVAHDWQATSCSGGQLGMKGMIFAANILALSAVKLMENTQLVEKAKEEFNQRMAGREYICPLPDSISIPQPISAED